MVISKRAQIFLLAAIVVSSVIISLGITANQARINSEPKNFYDFNYEVQREIGAVMDYEIYTNFSEGDDLEEFVDVLAENIQDNDPDESFTIVYGDKKGITIDSYGPSNKNKKKDEGDEGDEGDDSYKNPPQGTVSLGGVSLKMSSEKGSKSSKFLNKEDLEEIEDIVVEVGDNEVSFPVSNFPKAILLIQKDIGDESFVTTG
ncbi:MAG: hypothetical protein U9Q73_03090 [Nanoarchaeota archaeon]|nr:hypothetical protein [Nanoarchaeota archaeon]